ncbi:EamA family transporter RarD [Vibrio profundum]|uniref:EamA family transporter RarD n=1 Tax=Vibrio profundum TaxID=2910247 RepID=UPI003D137A54
MTSTRSGNLLAAFSFLLWGLTPLYYQLLPNSSTDDLLAIRIIVSVPFTAVLVYVLRNQWPKLVEIFSDRKSLMFATLASVVYCVSWYTFTWAMTNNHVMDASLAFFISPLMMVTLGFFIFRERMSIGKWCALLFALIGVMYQVVQYGQVPTIALTMALAFTIYGWCKKNIAYSWDVSLFVEALVLAPVALFYLLSHPSELVAANLTSNFATLALYLGSGPITLLPLIFYSMAVRRTDMSNIGLMQYIEPSLQFFLAITVFGEAFDRVKMVGFSFIWLGLVFIAFETLMTKYVRHKRLSH